MAHDFWKGNSRKNFAIQGHPPLGSYEYDFIRGLPPTLPPGYRPTVKSKKKNDVAMAYDSLGSVENVSSTDFDAASRWMSNLAEQVAFTIKTNKDALNEQDQEAWAGLWKRWLLLGTKVKQDNTIEKLKSTPNAVETMLPGLFPSRKLSRGVMSDETALEYQRLLHEAIVLYQAFRRKGLTQVAIPYMGDLVVMLRTLPPALTLTQMVTRLREAARGGDRLLDQNTAWWQWKRRSDTTGLRRAIDAARELADKFEKSSKIKGQGGSREKGSFAYDLFLQAVTKIPIEAAGLYGIEEGLTGARAELSEGKQPAPGMKGDLVTLAVAAVLGFIGYKWWTRPQTKIIVESFRPGYNPEDFEVEEPQTDFFAERINEP
jgi:hypothetical protein